MTGVKEILLAVIVGRSGNYNKISIRISLFTVQSGGKIQFLLCQILLDIIILDR